MSNLCLLLQPNLDTRKQNSEKECFSPVDILEKEEELGTSGTRLTGVRQSLLKEGGVTGEVTYLRAFFFFFFPFLVRTKSRARKGLCRLFRPHYQKERLFLSGDSYLFLIKSSTCHPGVDSIYSVIWLF